MKRSSYHNRRGKKNRFRWFSRSNHANEAVSFTLHSYHILQQKKTSVAESFPTTPRQMSLMLFISDIYHLFFYKSASAAIQSISIDTMIHLADSFIQSEQHCFEGPCYQFKHSLGTLQSCGGGGGSLLNHHQCAAFTWMMRRLPQDNGASALTTHQLQVERRESHRASQVYALTTYYRDITYWT